MIGLSNSQVEKIAVFNVGPRLIVSEDFAELAKSVDMFTFVQNIDGPIARSVKGRETRQFSFNQQMYYRKLHSGVGWGEIFKNLLRLRLPIIGARNEWAALNRLKDLSINSLTPVAFGERGINPATQRSFLITRELSNTIKLHELCEAVKSGQSIRFKKRLEIIQEIARIARTIHQHGINHRDFYFCHFLIDKTSLAQQSPIKIYLVDLHRAQIRSKVPTRWLIKDIASLHFSSRDYGISIRDYCRFLKAYFNSDLRSLLLAKHTLLEKISRRSDQLYAREQRLRARGLRP